MSENKGWIITIVILSLALIGSCGYIVYSTIQEKKEDAIKTTIIKNTSIDLNAFYQISHTLDSFDKAFNNPNNSYVGYIYVAKRLEAEKFDMGAALYASAVEDMSVAIRPNFASIPEEKLKYNFERIFGKNLTFSVAEIQSGETYKIGYLADTNSYVYYAPPEDNVYADKFIAMNEKTTLDNDKVYVYRKVFFAEYEKDSTTNTYTKVKIYRDYQKQNYIGSVNLRNGEYSKNEILSKYSSKLLSYKYTFVQEKDDDYSFYSIEATK